MAVNQKALLNLAENAVFQELEQIRLEQVETETVNRPDVHFCESEFGAKLITAEVMDAVFKLAGGFIGEGECDDIGGRDTFRGFLAENINNALGNNLRLPRAGAGNYLEIAVQVIDRVKLTGSVFHLGLLTVVRMPAICLPWQN
jgi:hypothetical protein